MIIFGKYDHIWEIWFYIYKLQLMSYRSVLGLCIGLQTTCCWGYSSFEEWYLSMQSPFKPSCRVFSWTVKIYSTCVFSMDPWQWTLVQLHSNFSVITFDLRNFTLEASWFPFDFTEYSFLFHLRFKARSWYFNFLGAPMIL